MPFCLRLILYGIELWSLLFLEIYQIPCKSLFCLPLCMSICVWTMVRKCDMRTRGAIKVPQWGMLMVINCQTFPWWISLTSGPTERVWQQHELYCCTGLYTHAHTHIHAHIHVAVAWTCPVLAVSALGSLLIIHSWCQAGICLNRSGPVSPQ